MGSSEITKNMEMGYTSIIRQVLAIMVVSKRTNLVERVRLCTRMGPALEESSMDFKTEGAV